MKFLLRCLIRIRWAYFHAHPGYQKFTLGTEEHFFHAKSNSTHCNYTVK